MCMLRPHFQTKWIFQKLKKCNIMQQRKMNITFTQSLWWFIIIITHPIFKPIRWLVRSLNIIIHQLRSLWHRKIIASFWNYSNHSTTSEVKIRFQNLKLFKTIRISFEERNCSSICSNFFLKNYCEEKNIYRQSDMLMWKLKALHKIKTKLQHLKIGETLEINSKPFISFIPISNKFFGGELVGTFFGEYNES